MIIGIDLDSVLNNLLDVWLDLYNRHYNDTLTPSDITTWDIHNHVKCGTRIYSYLTRPETYELCTPKPYAQGITQALSEQYTLICISAVAKNTFDVKKQWVQEYFPHIKHFVGTHSKQFIRADYLIDDAIHNLDEFVGRGIIFDMPYNQNCAYERVHNWKHVGMYFGVNTGE